MGFRFSVLLKGRSGHVCSMPWEVRGSVVSWANRSVGVPSCPAPPRPAAPPCAALPQSARGMSGFWFDKKTFILCKACPASSGGRCPGRPFGCTKCMKPVRTRTAVLWSAVLPAANWALGCCCGKNGERPPHTPQHHIRPRDAQEIFGFTCRTQNQGLQSCGAMMGRAGTGPGRSRGGGNRSGLCV